MSKKRQIECTIKSLEKLQAIFENLKGEIISVKEYLTTNEATYDRHFTSFSHFEFKVENSCLRFSGARFRIDGGEKAYYEIAADHLRDIFFDKNKVTLIENLSDKWIRKTEIVLHSTQQAAEL